jgi:hypothetical protein
MTFTLFIIHSEPCTLFILSYLVAWMIGLLGRQYRNYKPLIDEVLFNKINLTHNIITGVTTGYPIWFIIW